MRRLSVYRILFGCLLLLGLLNISVKLVVAESGHKEAIVRTYITLEPIKDTLIDDPFIVKGSIKDALGRPLADRSIQLKLDGEELGQARSDKEGIFQRQFSKALEAGAHTVTATYKGTSSLGATKTTIPLNILAADVRIQTVPPIAGIVFRLNGQEVVSNINGFADIRMKKGGKYRLEVLLDRYNNPSQRVEFGRWEVESYEPYLDIQVPHRDIIQVGLNVYHQVGQSFVDLDGYPVDSQRVEEFTIKSAQGDVFVLEDGQPRWIPASRIARRINGLEETKLLYSVISVQVDGSNVVNQRQQRFYTHPNETWTISLLLYSLHITARDALFGSPVGQSVDLKFPNGRIENYPLDQTGSTDIHSLARGNYSIDLVGTHGMASKTPVALSRNQVVIAKVLTYLDLAVFGSLGMIIALALLLYGRPWLIYAVIRRNPVLVPVSESVPDDEIQPAQPKDVQPNKKIAPPITFYVAKMPAEDDVLESSVANGVPAESKSHGMEKVEEAADADRSSPLVNGQTEQVVLAEAVVNEELQSSGISDSSAVTDVRSPLIVTEAESAQLTDVVESRLPVEENAAIGADQPAESVGLSEAIQAHDNLVAPDDEVHPSADIDTVTSPLDTESIKLTETTELQAVLMTSVEAEQSIAAAETNESSMSLPAGSAPFIEKSEHQKTRETTVGAAEKKTRKRRKKSEQVAKQPSANQRRKRESAKSNQV